MNDFSYDRDYDLKIDYDPAHNSGFQFAVFKDPVFWPRVALLLRAWRKETDSKLRSIFFWTVRETSRNGKQLTNSFGNFSAVRSRAHFDTRRL
jgi:hypothetical protein